MAEVLVALAGSAVLLAVATAIEFVAPITRYPLKSRLLGFALTLTYLAGGAAFLVAAQALWAALAIEPVAVVPVRGWLGDVMAVAVLVIASDFFAYWHHRALHRFAWPVHAVHHSQTELHAANSYGHLLEKVTQFLLIAVPLSIVRFDAAAVPFVVVCARQLLEYYIHSPIGAHFGPLRALLVDNRFHRIHHSTERRHFDRNFGILLSVWDRLFGTAYEPRPDEWPATGVADHPPPTGFSDYVLFPLRFVGRAPVGAASARAAGVRGARPVQAPPGWLTDMDHTDVVRVDAPPLA